MSIVHLNDGEGSNKAATGFLAAMKVYRSRWLAKFHHKKTQDHGRIAPKAHRRRTLATWFGLRSESPEGSQTPVNHLQENLPTTDRPSSRFDLGGVTQALAADSQTASTPCDPGMMSVRTDAELALALLPNDKVLCMTKKAILGIRKAREAEDDHERELEMLETQAYNLEMLIENTEARLSGANDSLTSSAREDHREDQDALKAWGQRLSGVKTKIEQCHVRRKEALDVQNNTNADFVSALDDALSGSGLIDRTTESESTPLSPDKRDILESDSRVDRTLLVDDANRENVQSEDNETNVPHKATSSLHASQSRPEQCEDIDADVLIRGFRMARARLNQAERDLESREEWFDEQKEARSRRLALGESIQTRLEFDHHLLDCTRRLTQEVRDAEEYYREKKDAAITGGVQVPDAESGFIDRSDDGSEYGPDLIVQMFDPESINTWLDSLPESEDESPLRSMDVMGNELTGYPELDDWDARTVEMSDSWSMRAEGAEKRRIEKWQAECEQMYAKDF